MTNKINGIDVSEEIRYCNNCSNLGLDFKASKFYCSLSHRSDELPEVLSCDEFSTNCYIKRLQEENEELQYSLKTQCVTCKRELENCRILFIADKYKQALEEVRDMLKIADKTKKAEVHFEYMDKALVKAKEVLNDRD